MYVTISTQDNVRLAADLYPARRPEALGVAVFLPATGSRRERYAAFAEHLAGLGWNAVTFDYRGIGGSVLARDEEHKASMQAWGEKDLTAVIDWARERFGPRRLVLVAHSIGGQIIPLAENHDHVDAVLSVAVQKGHWRLWPGAKKFVVWAFFRLYIPLCLRLFGRVPLGFAGLDDLPGNVAADYARWTLRLDYRAASGRDLTHRFAGFRAPILSLSFEDDTQYAPRNAVDFLMRHYYRNAPVWRSHLVPKALGLGPLGHSGFFDPQACPVRYWAEAADWLHTAADAKADNFSFRELSDAAPMAKNRPLPSEVAYGTMSPWQIAPDNGIA